MPIYEYKCKECGKVVELLLPMGENGVRPCPACNGEMVKIFSTFNSSFGWRPTDRSNERFGPKYEKERDI